MRDVDVAITDMKRAVSEIFAEVDVSDEPCQ